MLKNINFETLLKICVTSEIDRACLAAFPQLLCQCFQRSKALTSSASCDQLPVAIGSSASSGPLDLKWKLRLLQKMRRTGRVDTPRDQKVRVKSQSKSDWTLTTSAGLVQDLQNLTPKLCGPSSHCVATVSSDLFFD